MTSTVKIYFDERHYFENGKGKGSQRAEGLYVYPIGNTLKIAPLIISNNKYIPADSNIVIPLEVVPELIKALYEITKEGEKEEKDIASEIISEGITYEFFKIYGKNVFYNQCEAVMILTKEERRNIIADALKNMLFDIDAELLSTFTEVKDKYWMVEAIKHLQNGGKSANNAIYSLITDMEGLINYHCDGEGVILDALIEAFKKVDVENRYDLDTIDETTFEYEAIIEGEHTYKSVYTYLINRS